MRPGFPNANPPCVRRSYPKTLCKDICAGTTIVQSTHFVHISLGDTFSCILWRRILPGKHMAPCFPVDNVVDSHK